MANYFKDNLKYIREKKKLSKNKLGELTGVNQSTIGRWESGEITPTIDSVIDLMEALQIPINYLGSFLGKDLSLNNDINLETLITTNDNEKLINNNNEINFLEQYQLLFNKDDKLTEEQKKFFMDYIEEKHKEIDNEEAKKE